MTNVINQKIISIEPNESAAGDLYTEALYDELLNYGYFCFDHCERDVNGVGTFMWDTTFNEVEFDKHFGEPSWLVFSNGKKGTFQITGKIISIEKEIGEADPWDSNEYFHNTITVKFEGSDVPLTFLAMREPSI